MITNLKLLNFKRFSEADIPLSHINIFVGPNNSGKSSILAALKILKQTLDSYDEQVPLLLNGELGDFGTYKDLVFKNHRGKPMSIGFSMLASDSYNQDSKLEVSFNLDYKYSSSSRELILENIELSNENSKWMKLKYSKETSRYNLETHGNIEIPSSYKTILSRDIRVRHFLPMPQTVRLGLSGLSQRNTQISQFSEKYLDMDLTRRIIRVVRRVAEHFDYSDYLGPVRASPERTYLFTGERRQRIGKNGENMTTLLIKGSTASSRKSDVQNKVNSWLNKSQMAKAVEVHSISDRHYEIHVQNFFTGEKQNIADVGYGHSQVLPILVGGYSMLPNSTFIIEQPELHLHPKAQAELGDFFLDLFESGVQTVIETHSEHLILRLQQHIASGAIKPSDVAVYYIKNSQQDIQSDTTKIPSPEVTRINLNESGSFITDWPEGFFPERLIESRKLALLRHSEANQKQLFKN